MAQALPPPPPPPRPPAAEQPTEAGWWKASDDLWYSPEQRPGAVLVYTPPAAAAQKRSGYQRALIWVVALAMTGIVAPYVVSRIGRVSSDRQKNIDVQIALEDKLTQDLTSTVSTADLFGSKLILASAPAAPVVGGMSGEGQALSPGLTMYTQTLNAWLSESSQLGAEIYANFGRSSRSAETSRLICDWLPLFSAVTDTLRLSAAVEKGLGHETTQRLEHELRVDPDIALAAAIQFDELEDTSKPGFYMNLKLVEKVILQKRDLLVDMIGKSDVRGLLLSFFTVRPWRGGDGGPSPGC